MEMKDAHDEFIGCFVRGTASNSYEAINTEIGLGKGTEWSYMNVVLKENDDDVNILPPNQIKVKSQPDYIIV